MESDVPLSPSPWMIVPFALLLFAMALTPLVTPVGWARHYAKISFSLGGVTLLYYVLVLHDLPHVVHVARDYFSFIALAGSLYVIAGGIHIIVEGEATPEGNVLFLLAGALAANLLGTTGAAMLLIRPWIRMNHSRITGYHIVFFIFIVANVGGCLTPIGDPPLFLGYLRGVPFWWGAKNSWPMWLTGVGLLLAIFYVLDRINFSRAPREKKTAQKTWRCEGLSNLFFLAIILGAVFIPRPLFLREGLMLVAAAGSYFTTRKSVHEGNHFTLEPLREVAVLFAGIFATMLPALDWLDIHARDLLGDRPAPALFYWGTGSLSSVLDNAPTYLGFLTALFRTSGAGDIGALLRDHGASVLAISIGAVFFGAATYIGNGPNFMIKAIAEHKKVPTPGFIGYIVRYTLPFLLPTLIAVWWLFFR